MSTEEKTEEVVDEQEQAMVESWGEGQLSLVDSEEGASEAVDEEATEEASEETAEESAGEVNWEAQAKEYEKAHAGILEDLRKTRAEYKAERRQNAEALKRMEDRLAGLQERDAPTPAPPPDKEEDPMGYMLWKQEQLDQKLDASVASDAQKEQAAAFQAQVTQTVSQIQQEEARWIEEAEDVTPEIYEKALDHVRARIFNFYKGVGVPEEQLTEGLSALEIQWGHNILNAGGNPAQFFYEFAQSIGWQPPSNGTEEKAAEEGEEKPVFTPDKKVAGSRTLAKVSGKPTRGGKKITLDDLNNMPEAEYDRLVAIPGLWERINVEGSVEVS